MLNEQQIQGKWMEIKGGLKNLWGKLTDDELDQTRGNLQRVGGLVEEKYGESREDIKTKLDRLMASFDNDTDKDLTHHTGTTSYERSPIEPRTSAASQAQDKASEFYGDTPEREAFDEKTFAASQGTFEDPQRRSNYSGANPGRSTFGTGGGKASDSGEIHDADQEVDKRSYQARGPSYDSKGFDSDRNARH